ncbi:DUF6207 family protein [Streptomyces noursei]|uniref:DUF6207 family protein n=1 Tax=Streptomyces noursei TaxID=1971 RepID=UPI001C723DEF
MTDTAPWAGPGIVRVDITAADRATARAAAARIASLWESTGGERGQLAEDGTSASLYANITRPRRAGRRRPSPTCLDARCAPLPFRDLIGGVSGMPGNNPYAPSTLPPRSTGRSHA